jgi:hypothetical protein
VVTRGCSGRMVARSTASSARRTTPASPSPA